jgi:hypothetical protein
MALHLHAESIETRRRNSPVVAIFLVSLVAFGLREREVAVHSRPWSQINQISFRQRT